MSKKSAVGSISRQSSFAFKGGSESLNDAALQFKLSKKVAELTLVVHMLFTRNHEREVELESTKTAYEMEIDTITAAFKEEIHRIKDENGDYKMKHLQEIEQIKHENSEHKKKLVEAHNRVVTGQSVELEKCKSEMGTYAARMKRLQDEFDKLQKDYDLLSNERKLKNKVLEKDHIKIEKLQHQARINKEVMEKMKESIHSIQKSVNHKVQALERNNKVCNELADSLRLQNELLESDYRALKKKLADQNLQIKRLENQPAVPSCANSATTRAKTVESQSDRRSRDDEIERLKQEIQKYKLELSNRENNFNKIFSDIRPVMLNSGVCVRDSRELESRDEKVENVMPDVVVTKDSVVVKDIKEVMPSYEDKVSMMYQYKVISHIKHSGRLKANKNNKSLPNIFPSSRQPSNRGGQERSSRRFNESTIAISKSVNLKK